MTEAEKQYIDLYAEASEAIKEHSAEVMNAVRDRAFEDFRRQGFPTRKVERYKYTDMEKIFAPNYGLNVNRIEFPVDPYAAFRCDVPNLSTLLYFVVNDAFYEKRLPNVQPEEGVVIGSLRKAAEEHPELIARYYARIAKTEEDAITALNTMLAQDRPLHLCAEKRADGKVCADYQHPARRREHDGQPTRAHRDGGGCQG